MPALGGLHVAGLVAGYRGRALARLPQLDVSPGGVALLLGPSGAGKTTLLLALAGLADIIAGTVLIDNTAVEAMSPAARDHQRGQAIGLVFQDFHLIGGLTALENLMLAPFASGARQDRGRARALLGDLGLANRIDARASTLSRGEGQRVGIARAILLAPKLLLADEPTASLDDASAAIVFELLSEAARSTGAALVIATHDNRLKSVVAHQVMAVAA